VSVPKVGRQTIQSVMGDPIVYTGAGVVAKPISGIYSETPAAPAMFGGTPNTLMKVSFEIQMSALDGEPNKGDLIVHETGSWKVQQHERKRDAEAWIVWVDETAPTP
jgi:hypothetical protein